MDIRFTWEQFALIVFVLLVIYYLVVAMAFYQREVMGWIRQKSGVDGERDQRRAQRQVESVPILPAREEETLPIPPVRTHVYTHVHELLEEMKPVYASFGTGAAEKAEVLQNVTSILKKFAMIRGTPFQAAINNNIATELQRMKLSVTHEDVAACW